MKANETPEKIYIQPSTIEQLPHQNIVYTKPLADNSIEYIRADVFIKKACVWMKKSITNNPECNRIISKNGAITMGLLIEDFKKYMEGE